MSDPRSYGSRRIVEPEIGEPKPTEAFTLDIPLARIKRTPFRALLQDAWERRPLTAGEQATAFARGVPRGAVSMAAQATAGLAGAAQQQASRIGEGPTTPLEETVGGRVEKYVSDLLDRVLPIDPKRPSFAGEVGEGLGSTLASIPAGWLGGLARVNRVAVAVGVNALANGVGDYQNAIYGGGDVDGAWKALLGGAGVTTATGIGPIARLMRRIDERTGGGFMGAIRRGLTTGGMEAVNEVSEQITSNVLVDVLTPQDIDLLDGVLRHGVGVGGISGFLADLLLNAVGSMRMRGPPGDRAHTPVMPPTEPGMIGPGAIIPPPSVEPGMIGPGMLVPPLPAAEGVLAEPESVRVEPEVVPEETVAPPVPQPGRATDEQLRRAGELQRQYDAQVERWSKDIRSGRATIGTHQRYTEAIKEVASHEGYTLAEDDKKLVEAEKEVLQEEFDRAARGFDHEQRNPHKFSESNAREYLKDADDNKKLAEERGIELDTSALDAAKKADYERWKAEQDRKIEAEDIAREKKEKRLGISKTETKTDFDDEAKKYGIAAQARERLKEAQAQVDGEYLVEEDEVEIFRKHPSWERNNLDPSEAAIFDEEAKEFIKNKLRRAKQDPALKPFTREDRQNLRDLARTQDQKDVAERLINEVESTPEHRAHDLVRPTAAMAIDPGAERMAEAKRALERSKAKTKEMFEHETKDLQKDFDAQVGQLEGAVDSGNSSLEDQVRQKIEATRARAARLGIKLDESKETERRRRWFAKSAETEPEVDEEFESVVKGVRGALDAAEALKKAHGKPEPYKQAKYTADSVLVRLPDSKTADEMARKRPDLDRLGPYGFILADEESPGFDRDLADVYKKLLRRAETDPRLRAITPEERSKLRELAKTPEQIARVESLEAEISKDPTTNIRDLMNRIAKNPKAFAGIPDPETIRDLVKLAGLHIRQGMRRVGQFVRKMVRAFGEFVRKHARKAWTEAKSTPIVVEAGMAEEVARRKIGATPKDIEAMRERAREQGVPLDIMVAREARERVEKYVGPERRRRAREERVVERMRRQALQGEKIDLEAEPTPEEIRAFMEEAAVEGMDVSELIALENTGFMPSPIQKRSKEQIKAEIADVASALGRTTRRTTLSGIPTPEQVSKLLRMARLHIDLGARTFEEWVAKTPDFDRGALRKVWDSANAAPEPPSEMDAPTYVPTESAIGRVAAFVADSMRPVKNWSRAIDAKVESDPYLAEALWRGRALDVMRTHLFRRFMRPIAAHMQRGGLSGERVGEWLVARHANERNREIRKLYKEGEGPQYPAGISDEDAQAILERWKSNEHMQIVGRVWDRMNRWKMLHLAKAGVEEPEFARGLIEKYPHWAPLRDIDPDEIEYTGMGRGLDLRSPSFQRAFGRATMADNPLHFGFTSTALAIIRAAKAVPGQRALAAARLTGDPSVVSIDEVQHKMIVDQKSGLARKVWDRSADNDPEVVIVRDEGKRYRLRFGREYVRIASAMKGSNVLHGFGENDPITPVLRGLGRFYSGVLTRNNPFFTPFNLVKDAVLGGVISAGEKGVRIKFEDLPSAYGALWRARQGKGGDTKLDEYAREYTRAGAPVSFLDLGSLEQKVARIKGYTGHGGIRMARDVFDLIGDVNDIVENGTRFLSYVAIRERGSSVDESAFYGKELTTNFERKGEIGPTLNAFYIFSTAGIGGLRRAAQAMRHPGVRKILLGVVATHIVLDLANNLIATEDDDGENFYDKVLDDGHTTNNNLVIFYGDTDGDYITVPLPWVYRWFAGLGTNIGAMMRGAMTPEQATARSASALFEELDPLGGGSHPAQTVSPWFMDPLTDVWVNREWTGQPIVPMKYDPTTPDSELVKDAPEWIASASRVMNRLSGGTSAEAGLVDVSPETIEHFLRFLTPGALGEAARVVDGLAEGDIERRHVPIVRRLTKAQNPWYNHRVFRDNLETIRTVKKRIQANREAGLDPPADSWKVSSSWKDRASRTKDAYEKLWDIHAKAETSEERRRIEDRMLALVKRFNRALRFAEEKHGSKR